MFSDAEAALVENSLFIHNHPSGQTFSRADIRFVAALNPLEFCVVTAQKRYCLLRPTTGWPPDLWTRYEKIFALVYQRVKKEYDNGKINERVLNRRIYAEAIKRLTRDFSLDYREEDF